MPSADICKILLIEPYYGGSHKYCSDNLKARSKHHITLMTLPARNWKWRMQGSAYIFSERIKALDFKPEIVLVSDMCDLALLRSLLVNHLSSAVFIYYMHENQLSYPLSSKDQEKHFDLSYGYLNYKSCLSADRILFNSHYHQDQFYTACEHLLNKMPDYKHRNSLKNLINKSDVRYIGLDSKLILEASNESKIPNSILWNHRWDEDKKPEYFKYILDKLQDNNLDFNLILTKQSSNTSSIYKQILTEYASSIKHAGHMGGYQDYLKLLGCAEILFVSPGHDFFGISVLEAVGAGVTPLLPKSKVYEEHWPSIEFPELYYNDEEDLIAKLSSLLAHSYETDPRLAERVRKYDWEKLIETYDDFFTACCA